MRLLESNDCYATRMVLLGIALATGVNVSELLVAPVPCVQSVQVQQPHGVSDHVVPQERTARLHQTSRPRHLGPRNRIVDRWTSE